MSPTPAEFLQRINEIIGDTVADGAISVNLTWGNRAEAKAALTRIRQMQIELRVLKQQVSVVETTIRSDFTTKRTAVGKSIGAGIAAGLFGRHNMGRVNAVTRANLRRDQIAALEPYAKIKRVIDALVQTLNEAKGRILTSGEYQP
jgi:hypothetical protein